MDILLDLFEQFVFVSQKTFHYLTEKLCRNWIVNESRMCRAPQYKHNDNTLSNFQQISCFPCSRLVTAQPEVRPPGDPVSYHDMQAENIKAKNTAAAHFTATTYIDWLWLHNSV